ncbi:hypothetical protein HK100_009352, partial [Physocladia obscura]
MDNIHNANHWNFSEHELMHPPSSSAPPPSLTVTASSQNLHQHQQQHQQIPLLTLADDRDFRAKAARFIYNIGLSLKLPANVIATAQVFMHRFYMRESFRKHRYQDVSTAALFLATKVEENARRLKQVIQVAAQRALKSDLNHKIDESSREFKNWWDNTLYYEELILSTLCWDLNVDYPYEWILKLCKLLKAPAHLKASAWAVVNDSYRLPLCLQYKSQELACGCMTVALTISLSPMRLSSDHKNPDSPLVSPSFPAAVSKEGNFGATAVDDNNIRDF